MYTTTLITDLGTALEHCWNNFSIHTSTNTVRQSLRGYWTSLQINVSSLTDIDLDFVANQVHEIAMSTLCFIVTTLIFFANSGVFILGLAIGIVNTELMEGMIDDITVVWQDILNEKKFMQLAGLTTAAVIAFPATMIISPFFVGGYYGADLLNSARAVDPAQADEDFQELHLPPSRENDRPDVSYSLSSCNYVSYPQEDIHRPIYPSNSFIYPSFPTMYPQF